MTIIDITNCQSVSLHTTPSGWNVKSDGNGGWIAYHPELWIRGEKKSRRSFEDACKYFDKVCR